jgi:AcrR family transcriptional regulator
MTVTMRSTPATVPDLRSAEILDSARRAFIEKGFDGASMQDLARAAGMSVGNFYRYFPSKAAIVAALITRDLDEVEQDFREILGAPEPLALLRDKLAAHVCGHAMNDDGPLWAEITAAAGRKPEIGEILARMETEIAKYLTAVFALVTGLPRDEAARRYGAHAGLLMLLIKGSATCSHGPKAQSDDLNALILRTVDRTLAEISSENTKV